jgi:signal transduction histidine kinase
MVHQQCEKSMFERDSEERLHSLYRSIFENAPDATVVFDESNSAVVSNRAARQLDFYERVFASDAPWAFELAAFRREIRSAGRAELEVRIGDRVILLRGRPHGSFHIVTLSDVTELRRLEGALRAFERVESVGLMTASLVHDFNNLLMPIATTSAFLLRQLEQGSDAMDMVRDIQAAADRAVSMIRQVLKVVRRSPANVEELSLSSVVSDIQPLVRRVAGPAIRTDLVLGGGTALVRLDRERLERVILNLVANARDAMPSGGRITLSTSEISFDEDEANAIPGARTGSYVALRVSDIGTGITSEARERIFGGFFTTKDAGHGTGLGLAMVHRFVTQSRGCIAINSQPGRGTTVSLYFPAAPLDARGD